MEKESMPPTAPEPKGKKKLNKMSREELQTLAAHLLQEGQGTSKRFQQIQDLLPFA